MTNNRLKILIADDIEVNRIILEQILIDEYEIEHAEDGLEAITKMVSSTVKPALLLLDIMMPGMDGFEVISFMKTDPVLKKIPVIFITAADRESQGLRAGALDYISKPFEPEIVKLRVSNQIELSLYRNQLENLVEQKVYELIAVKENILEAMSNLIEYRSLESGEHVKRTKSFAKMLIEQLIKRGKYRSELMNENLNALIKAVPLHDIGKIAIPDSILLKPGRLTPEEFEIMKSHTTVGSLIIKSLIKEDEDEYRRHCYNICRYHHERWDGNGYPDKLSGTDIPLSARIVSIVDVYDALTSERCYKKAASHEEALDIIKQSSGKQFDDEIVNALMDVHEQFKNFSV